jgi:uncharacterized protein (UPF0332 family)
MAARGLSSSKHSGVMATFNREFIKTGIFIKEYGQLYKMLFESRQRSDYQDFVSFDREEVEEWLEQSAEFVAIVESYLKKQ